MTSKAQKLKSKRAGRKIKAGMARTDTGRISRAKDPGEAPDKVARDARTKIFGVDPKDAGTAQGGGTP